jgi:hypothetical protein
MQDSRIGGSHRVELSLKHPGTGRLATVLCVQDFTSIAPVSIAAGKYVLVIASEKQTGLTFKTARAWIDAGASYVCAWGPNAAEIEDAFDYAAFLPEYGEPLPFTLMTTSHRDETPEDALWFAFYNATAPDDLGHELGSIVVIVDTGSLLEFCNAWVTKNTE